MTRSILVLAALLAFCASANAQIPRVVRVLEKSYELGFADVVFPQSPVGTVNVKPCESCARVVHSVTTTTVYMHNDLQVSFEAFQKLLEDRRTTSQPTYVMVHYSIDTNLVTRIRVKTE